MASAKSSVIFDIGAKVNKSYKASLNAVGTSFAKMGNHVSKSFKEITNGENAVKNYTRKLEGLRNILDNTTDKDGNVLSNALGPTPKDESKLNSTLKGYMETIRHAQEMVNQLRAENPFNSKTGRTKLEDSIEQNKQDIEDFKKEIDNLTKNRTTSINWEKILNTKDLDKIKADLKDTDFKDPKSIVNLRNRKVEINDTINSSKPVSDATAKLSLAKSDLATFESEKGVGAWGWKTQYKAVTDAEKELSRVREQALKEYTKELKEIDAQLQKQTSLSNLSAKSDIYGEAKTKAIANASTTLENLNKALDTNTKKLATNTEAQAHQASIIDTAKTKYNEYISSKQQEAAITETYLNNAQAKVDEAYANIGSTIRNFTTSRIVDMFNKMGNAAKKFGQMAVKWFSKAAGAVTKTATKAIGLEQIMKAMIQYGFGFRSLYYLLNNIKSALADGLTYLSKATGSVDTYAKEAATQMKELLKQVKELVVYLKAAGAVMIQPFMPLIQSILPKLIQLFNTLSNTVARFIAQLTGQGYFLKASINLEDYANALDTTTKSAKKAADALGAYDKLNVIDHDSDPDTSNWFTSEKVDPSSFMAKIKEAWSKLLNNNNWSEQLQAKFESIGADIGSWFSDKLASIDWEGTILPRSEKISKALASVINGIFTDPNLGTEAGNAIAQFINTLVTFTASFFRTLDYSSIGQSIADAVDSFFSTFDFNSFGGIVNSITTGVLTLLNEVVGDPNLGTNIGTAIGELFAGLDVTEIASNLFTFIGNLVTAFGDALVAWAETDPESFGIARAIGIAIVGVKITSSIISPLGQALATALGGSLAQQLQVKLGTQLVSAFADMDLASISSAIVAKASGLFTSLDTSLTGLFTSISKNGLFKTIGTSISDGLVKMLSGVWGAVSSIGTALANLAETVGPIAAVVAIIAALVAGFERAYEESEEFRNIVSTAIESVKDVLQSAWDNVISPVFDLVKSIVEPILDAIIDLVAKLWESILPPLVTILKTVCSIVSNTVLPILKNIISTIKALWQLLEPVITWIIGILGDVLAVVIDVVTSIVEVVSPIIEFLTNTLGGIIQSGQQSIINCLNYLGEKWKNFWEGLKSVVKAPINWIIGMINKFLSAIASGLNIAVRALNKLSFKMPNWIPGVGGKSFGLNLKEVTATQIPYLAKGAVIPPNKEFMAVLGDQKQGTNIEAPLDTIKQALAETLASYGGGTNSQPIVLQLDGKTVAKVVWDENKKRYKQTGKAYSY